MVLDAITAILYCLGAYAIGSLPTAIWYGEAFFGIDVRNFGSGNAGATNTFRVLGTKPGIIVLLIDAFKGWTATIISFILIHNTNIHEKYIPLYGMLFGALAVVGHIIPLFANFKGGKGVATSLGMVFGINPELALICLIIFLVIFLTTNYVSLGSITAAFAYPLLMLSPRFLPSQHFMVIFGYVMFAIVVLTHQKNIIRLLHGEEGKIYLFRKKRS
ncbi:MAG: glycerol-3-phosphate 1-O-acyltransferase PlsY [Opitutaceae bacterium]|nr:glycerol-3-phosphate 1-O-acyltransferase PlsY [Cytophagales bacterium]